MDLSIIIINWRSADFVMKCLRSIREHTRRISYEVIVLDNASFDGCGDCLAREHPDARFIQSNRNLGFALANNLASEQARGEALLFLNPDTEVRTESIERLHGHLQALPDAGVVGCRLLNSDGSVQMSCVQSLPTLSNQLLDSDLLRRWFPRSSLWGITALLDRRPAPVEVEAVTGACMLLRRKVFEQIGGFSADYFMYTEDLDLCFKARRAGLRNYHASDVVIVHHGCGSSSQQQNDFANVMRRISIGKFLRKSRGRLYAGLYRMALSAVALVRLSLLALAMPIQLARGRDGASRTAGRKWRAIFCWGIGFSPWPRRYRAFLDLSAGTSGGETRSCAESAEN